MRNLALLLFSTSWIARFSAIIILHGVARWGEGLGVRGEGDSPVAQPYVFCSVIDDITMGCAAGRTPHPLPWGRGNTLSLTLLSFPQVPHPKAGGQLFQIEQRQEVNRLEGPVDGGFATDVGAHHQVHPQQLRGIG